MATPSRRGASFKSRPLTRGRRRPHRIEALEPRLMLSTNSWSGTLATGVTTWHTGDVEQVTGNLVVPVGGTLSIEPGVIVQFNSFAALSLTVNGALNAQGSAGNQILIT